MKIHSHKAPIRSVIQVYKRNRASKQNYNNHEIWRRCFHCNIEWDARKELSGTDCPKCGNKGKV